MSGRASSPKLQICTTRTQEKLFPIPRSCYPLSVSPLPAAASALARPSCLSPSCCPRPLLNPHPWLCPPPPCHLLAPPGLSSSHLLGACYALAASAVLAALLPLLRRPSPASPASHRPAARHSSAQSPSLACEDRTSLQGSCPCHGIAKPAMLLARLLPSLTPSLLGARCSPPFSGMRGSNLVSGLVPMPWHRQRRQSARSAQQT